MTAKQREQRLTNLTLSEIADLKDDAVVYEGVGKMYVGSESHPLLSYPEAITHPTLQPPLTISTPWSGCLISWSRGRAPLLRPPRGKSAN